MTDMSPDPDWWLASDGRWYPPHLHPDVRVDVAPIDVVVDVAPIDVIEEVAPIDVVEVEAVPMATPPTTATSNGRHLQFVPPREPIDWSRVAAERAARRRAEEARRRKQFVGAALASIGSLAVFFAVARNESDDDRAEPASSTTTPAVTTTIEALTTTAPPTTLTDGSVSVFTLQPGTCVSNADLVTGLVTSVTEVACELPHSHEVYHKVTYTPPDGAYNAERISQFASEQCAQSFATYVGIPYDRSQFYFLNFAPTEESWNQKGDREVVCLLFLQGSELSGSAKGTAQ